MPAGRTGTLRRMTQSTFVRISADIVVEVTDAATVRAAALEAVKDVDMPDDERAETVERINSDLGDAVAMLVDLNGFIAEEPGLQPVEAAWSAEVDEEYEPEEDEE